MPGSAHLLRVACLGVLLLPTLAHAQPGMGMGGMGGPGMGGMGGGMGGMGGGPGGAGGPGAKKKEGPAEAAPKDKQALRPIEAVPAQPVGQRRLQLFEIHGYLRARGDYFHRMDMNLPDLRSQDAGWSSNDFFRPPAQTDETGATGGLDVNDASCSIRLSTQGVPFDKVGNRCRRRNGFASANMRLRMEPTLHITDTVKIHAQIDALDNLVLGSTPDSYGWDNPNAPIDFYTRTQTPPTSGVNSVTDSILVKRAWGHIRFGFGLELEFGRMPRHWGMGIVYNDGRGYARGQRDDIVRMIDTDYGDTIDTVRFSYDFGKDRRKIHKLSVSWDWAASGPTTAQTLGPQWDSGGRVGQSFSVEKFDNVQQWTLALERRDSADMLARKLTLDEPVVNYGAMALLRRQDVDRAIGAPGLGDGLGTNPYYYDSGGLPPNPPGGGGATLGNGDLDDTGDTGLENYAALLVHRRALLFTPDLWMRVNWRTLRVELEAAGNIGRFSHRNYDSDDPVTGNGNAYFDGLTALDTDTRTRIMSLGYALEFKYGFFRDRFHIGFDQGFATGDTARSVDGGDQNPLLTNDDRRANNFRFNPAYMQDLLLFREMLGTISNAAYFRPWAAFYFFDENVSARADVMYAVAHRKESTIGDKASYGIELDFSLRYHDKEEPIFVAAQYGVLFPLGAFNRIDGDGLRSDAKAPQTLQLLIGIRF